MDLLHHLENEKKRLPLYSGRLQANIAPEC